MGLSTIVSAVKHIISLPNISSSEAPQLSSHISSAKAFAQEWLDTHSKTLVSSLSATGTIYDQWVTSHKHRLDVWEGDVSANKSKIKSLLQEAEGEADRVKDGLSSVLSQITSDDSRLTTISGDLVGDAQKISSQISADKETIRDLQLCIAEAQSKIDEYNARQKWYWLGGPLFWVIAHEIDALASNVSGYEHEVSAYRKTESGLEADSRSLTITMTGVSNWMSAMKIATASFGALNEGTNSLVGDLTDVIGKIEDADPSTLGVWMIAQIISIDKDYDQIGRLTKDLRS